MPAVVTIRDVPDEVRDLLAEEARSRGQSLQGFLLAVLRRQAGFSRNRQVLAEIGSELELEGGAGADAPDAAWVLGRERGLGSAGTAAEHRTSA
jgi:hypothetical protein